jgi:hypothetical protein
MYIGQTFSHSLTCTMHDKSLHLLLYSQLSEHKEIKWALQAKDYKKNTSKVLESAITFGTDSVKSFYTGYQESKTKPDSMVYGLSKSQISFFNDDV